MGQPSHQTGQAETGGKSDNLSVDRTAATGQPPDNPFAQRYQRYRPIIEWVASESHFDLPSVCRACDNEKPAFVTRLVNRLVREGWLLSCETPQSYRWNQDRGDFSVSRWLDQTLLGDQILASPEQGRPRERLLELGAEQLSLAELLAILIRSGRPGESAVTAGDKLARHYQRRLELLPSAGRGELKTLSAAVQKTAYCQIMAGIELGRRVAERSLSVPRVRIRGSEDAVAFCERRFARLMCDGRQEEFHIVTLDTKHQAIDTHQITIGTLDSSLVHPREVFRAAIRDAAAAMLLVHNHPSGDATPSRADHAVTDRLTQAGKLMGIEVLDHIILATSGCLSLRSIE